MIYASEKDEADQMLRAMSGILRFSTRRGGAVLSPLTPEEEAEEDEADAGVARGGFATDEEVRAVWAKHGL